jgi:hypothetical protein
VWAWVHPRRRPPPSSPCPPEPSPPPPPQRARGRGGAGAAGGGRGGEALALAGGGGLEEALAAALRSRWRRQGEENELGGDIFDLGFRNGVYIPQTKKSSNLSHRMRSIAV